MVPYVARERMSGPKHLWSGDWQRESAASTARSQRAPRVPDSETPESSAPTPARPARGLKGPRRHPGAGRCGLRAELAARLLHEAPPEFVAPGVGDLHTDRPHRAPGYHA